MLAPAGLILSALCGQVPDAPAWVETASAAQDPFDALYTPGAPAPEAPPGAPRSTMKPVSPSPAAPGGPREFGPGAPRFDPPPTPAPEATVVRQTSVTRWYRWPVLGADLVFAAMALVGLGLENTPLAATGALGYAFASPALHWGYGNLNGGLLSLTTHSLAPAALGLLGALFGAVANSAGCSGTNCGGSDRPYFFAGVAIGAAATTALDVLWFAQVEEAVPSLTLAPTFHTRDGVTHVGLGGRF